MLKRDQFTTVFHLSQKQPWLAKKAEALVNLLFEDCTSEDEQNLLIDLIDRFNYLDDAKIHAALVNIATLIIGDESCNESNTCVIATTMDTFADSAQFIVYRLKPIFEENGWHSPMLINQANKVIRHLPDKNQLFFVDEFIGTGKSMLGRVTRLKGELAGVKCIDYRIKVFCIAASQVGVKLLNDNGVDVHAELVIGKAISDHYQEDAKNKLQLMKKIESLLSSSFNDRELPSLGYGMVEALYAREYGNTPNNVFPIFWWPFYKDQSKRLTLLTRSMGDA